MSNEKPFRITVGQILEGKEFQNKDGSVTKGPSYFELKEDLPAGTIVEIIDFRALPEQLFKDGIINEARYNQMMEYAARQKPFVVRNLEVKKNREGQIVSWKKPYQKN